MKTIKKQGYYTVLAAVLLLAFSSCSRGYGCPYDFSTGKMIGNVFSGFISNVISLF